MTSSRTRRLAAEREAATGASVDEPPELNRYDIHPHRTVFTEPGNSDGWIATDYTVTPPE